MIQATHILILALSFVLSTPLSVHPQQVTVLGPDLKPRATTLDKVTLTDENLLRLILRAEPTQPLNNKQYVARLTNGQVLIGTFLGTDEDGESIRLAMGYGQRMVSFSLDDLLSFAIVGTPLNSDTNDDKLFLSTGETLVGFVDAINKDNISFVIGEADDPIQIPIDRLLGFTIANKSEPVKPEKGMARVMLRDGSLLLLRDTQLKLATATLVGTQMLGPDSPTHRLPISEVKYIEPMSEGQAIRPLTEFPMSLVSGGEVFGVSMPPKYLPDGSINLHAPTVIGFDLPKGAVRLTLQAGLRLDESIPPSRRELAGCELVIMSDGKAISKHELKPGEPPVRVNIPLAPGTLELQIKPGVNGPVLDRVRITDAELLIQQPS